MHMADALLSPPVGVTFWAISGGAVVYSARKLKEEAEERRIPLMGVVGAFVFAAQMINFTIPGTGSSGHLAGGMILAILLGPYAGFLTLASVLIIQALFFGDGGLLALGCNIFNMGFWTCFVAYPLLYKSVVGKGASGKRAAIGAVIATVAALQMGSLSVVFQTLFSGISELPFKSFLLLMQPIHLAIGLVEGVVTAGFIAFVRKTRPEILESTLTRRPLGGVAIRKFLIGLTVVAVLIGGVLSWFASSRPDGLEWAIAKITGGSGVSQPVQGVIPTLGKIQEGTAILPDYGFRTPENPTPDPVSPGDGGEGGGGSGSVAGQPIAGIVGAMLTLGLSVLFGLVLKRRRKARQEILQ
jgi:cobalt/nickel transport system permease protein